MSLKTQAFSHVNRRGETYFLQAKKKGGGYFFGRKPTGTPVATLPEGYEVYEKPEDAQVLIRRIKPSPILPSEEEAVRQAVRKLAGLEHFIVEKEGKSLTIYLTDIEPEGRLSLIALIAPMSAAQAEDLRREMIARARYEKMIQFTLIDPEKRRFIAQRWCFLGSIDDWHYLGGDAPLAELLAQYVPHLGRESFFDLV